MIFMKNHREPNRRPLRRLLLSGAALLMALMAALLLVWKSDWCFVAVEAVSAVVTSAPREEVDAVSLSLQSWNLEEWKADPRVTVDQSLMLINEAHPLPEGFVPDLAVLGEDTQVNACLASAYASLKTAVRTGYDQPLYIRSAYRSEAEQQETAETLSDVAAQVGCSEHQAGLALDVYVPSYGGSAFLKCDAGQFVNRDCWQYGFIIRYPYYGEAETNIPYEPWHLRYVGAPHAEYMMKNHLTLEGYLEGLTPGVWYRCGEYLLSRQPLDSPSLPETFASAVVSPDNTGYLIVTVSP